MGPSTADMVATKIVVAPVKKMIKKPPKKAAKKSPKKKAAKKAPKKKKAKKPKKKKKKKKAKKVRFVGGKRAKGQHKSKASQAAGKKRAAAMKSKGLGIFAPKSLSADLSAITGKNKMARTEVTKSIWAYIKKNKL